VGEAIEVTGVSVRYGRVTALEDVHLSVAEGQTVVLLGRNGAGKSTLLRVMAGLLRPQLGSVAFGEARTPAALRRAVSYCPDHGALYPCAAPEIGRLLATAWPGWDGRRFAGLCAELDVPEDRPATALSKGEAARLRLALTLSRPGRAVLLDEPFAGIDPASRTAVARILTGHIADAAPAVVVATHELRDVEGLFDRVLLLSDGRLRCDEDADALRARTGASLDDLVKGDVPA